MSETATPPEKQSRKASRSSLLKVRMRPTTKDLIIEAAALMDLDQSNLARVAICEYIEKHCPTLRHARQG